MTDRRRNTLGKYRLEGKIPVECIDAFEWGEWFEHADADRIVARTDVGEVYVSTVFLGIDHNWSGEGRPVLFETMVFRAKDNQSLEQVRYCTWAEAEEGHAAMVALVERGLLDVVCPHEEH